MSRQFTSQQVATHNQEHPDDKYAVINGDVYRIGSIPFNKCKTCTFFHNRVLLV